MAAGTSCWAASYKLGVRKRLHCQLQAGRKSFWVGQSFFCRLEYKRRGSLKRLFEEAL